jgi:hypothetical protein
VSFIACGRSCEPSHRLGIEHDERRATRLLDRQRAREQPPPGQIERHELLIFRQ